MKPIVLCNISIFYVLYLFFSQIPFTQLTAQNLILNPSCEDSLINNEIPYWTEVIGDNWTQRFTSPEPYSGDAYFFPGVASTAELIQDVDVSEYAIAIDDGIQLFVFEGYVRSYPQNPTDYARIVIDYLDTTKLIKLDSIDFGNYSTTSAWVQLMDTSVAPVGTRFVRIRLISTRRNGSNNDGYYDALSLSIPTTSVEHEMRSSSTVILIENFPNPFTIHTTIEYELKQAEKVTLTIYDYLGKQVDVIQQNQSQGKQQHLWNAERYPDGIYYYKLQVGEMVASGKMVKVK